jgi:hypothetical protein
MTYMKPCILCGKEIEIHEVSGVNKVYFPPTQKRYAYCTGGCDDAVRYDTEMLWERIAAMPEEARVASEIQQ